MKKSFHSFLFIIISLVRFHSKFILEENIPMDIHKPTKFLAGFRIFLEKLIKLRLILRQVINFDFLLTTSFQDLFLLLPLDFFFLLFLSLFTFLGISQLCGCFVIHVNHCLIFHFFQKLFMVIRKFLS